MQQKDDWKVSIFCFVVMFFFIGIQGSCSYFFIEVMNFFNINRELAEIPFTILLFIVFLLGPFAGYIGTLYDPSTVALVGCLLGATGISLNFVAHNIISFIVFWGILHGIGQGIAYSVIPQILSNSFKKNFSTACGITYSGSRLGSVLLPFISKALVEAYNLSGGFLMLGGLVLHTVPLMCILRFSDSKKHKSPENGKPSITIISGRAVSDSLEQQQFEAAIRISSEDRTETTISAKEVVNSLDTSDDVKDKHIQSRWYPFLVFADPTFLAILFLQGLHIGIGAFIATMMLDLYLEKNISVDDGIYILAAMYAVDTVSRICLGRINDSGVLNDVKLTILCLILMMASFISLVWCSGLISCLVPSLLFGFGSGGVWTLIFSILKNYSKEEFEMIALSSKNVFSAPIILTIPSIIGLFKDRMGSYDGVMFTLSGVCLFCIFLTYSIPYLAKWRDEGKFCSILASSNQSAS